jgi:hypothetical protein
MRLAATILICAALLNGAGPSYLGSESSGRCHAEIYNKQSKSNHAHALRPIRGSELERLLKSNPIGERGGYRFEYRDASPGLTVTARGTGGDDAAATLEWAFGTGSVGMTPVGRYADGQYFEHRVSYYAQAKRLGITPGQPVRPSSNATQALGTRQKPGEIRQCFNCHSTRLDVTSDAVLDLTSMEPGVQCERCHGPGEAHAEAASRNRPRAEILRTIANAGRFDARASVEFCGACHRLPDPSLPDPEPERVEAISIRFQPMGLLASRCFSGGSSLTCLTCHDPHTNAVRNDAVYYSSKCVSCHSAAVAAKSACARTTDQNCVSCHMRRSSPFPHFTFTDHRIRVYRP